MQSMKIVEFLVGQVQSGDVETLKVVLPIVGITVVLGGLSLLAVILKQFIFLSKEGREAQKAERMSSKTAMKKESNIVEKKESSPSDDDEMAAVATALYLYMSESGDSVNLTEVPQQHNVSPWTFAGRKFQGRRYDRWMSQKVR